MQKKLQSEENFLPNEEGWDKGLFDLDAYLTANTASENNKGQNAANSAAEEPGYREMPEQQKVAGGK